jgi:transcriptional regulator with XRE-family HTH domain
MKKEVTYQRSKLGMILKDRDLTLKEFAEMIFIKTGYFIAITNLSNYCTGYRAISSIKVAQKFAETLELPITDIL